VNFFSHDNYFSFLGLGGTRNYGTGAADRGRKLYLEKTNDISHSVFNFS
jgi:hypothetical protein